MRTLNGLEIGLMFWSGGDAARDIECVRSFGLQAGQLGFGGELDLGAAANSWRAALPKNSDFSIATAVCSYVGEDYTDIASVRATVGLLPESTRAERVVRTKQIADVAAEFGIRSVACHIGFIPENPADSTYRDLRDVVRDICDDLRARGQTFVLETGQESADALLAFMAGVARSNLKINFDPANMILYGTGDPIEALRTLGEHVVSVHCKDGVAPNTRETGSLGVEKPLGTGEVDFPAFLETLKEIGYRGILSIEREEADFERRKADIRHAVNFLSALSVP